jgi:hypothetical protein
MTKTAIAGQLNIGEATVYRILAQQKLSRLGNRRLAPAHSPSIIDNVFYQ